MNSKAKFTLFLIMGCFLTMIGISGQDKGRKDLPIAVIGTLIDGTGAEPVPEAVVVIEDGSISAVGPRGKIKIPGHARILRFPGGTLLPGFINAHVHSKYDEEKLQTWAREGVTTVRDLGEAADKPWFALRDRLRANPKNARIVAAGPVLTCAGGFIEEVSLIVASAEDARDKVNKLIDAGADVIKVGLNSPLLPELSPDVVKAIVRAAHDRGKPVAAHVVSAHGMGVAVEAGIDDISHLAPIGDKSEALIRQTQAAGIYWIPTLEPRLGPPQEKTAPGNNPPAADQAPPKGRPTRREMALESFKSFLRLGGLVALGNDAGTLPGVHVGMPIKEILSLQQEAGMTPMQIIVAATLQAARVCRLDKELGTLERGKRADLLVVEGNPLEDLRTLTKIRLVIHDGVIIQENESPDVR